MRFHYIIFFLFLFSIEKTYSQVWEHLSVFSTDSVYYGGNCIDDSKNMYHVCFFSNSLTFQNSTIYSNGKKDIAVAKFNSNGDLVWIRSFGNKEENTASSIVLDNAGNVTIMGCFLDTLVLQTDTLISSGGVDGFLLQLDSNGNYKWGKSFGTKSDDLTTYNYNTLGSSLTIDPLSSSIYLATYFGESTTPNAKDTLWCESNYLVSLGKSDILLAKLDRHGKLVWMKNFGSTTYDSGGKLSFSSGYISCSYLVSSNSCLVDQNTVYNPYSNYTLIISNFDSNGNNLWNKFGTVSQGFGSLGINNLASDDKSNIYGVGSFYADQIRFDNKVLNQNINTDVFVLKYSKDGTIKWLRKGGYYGGPNNATLVTVDKEYRVWVFGKASGAFTFGGGGDTLFTNGTSIFVWQCDTLGYEQQLYSVGLASYAPTGISQSPNGDILLSGYAQNTILTFGNLTANVGNQPTLFLARLSTGWPLSIENVNSISKDEPEVYPNPASQQVSVALPKYNGYTRVFVYDMQGRQVYGVSTQKQQAHFPVISWPRGTYIIKVTQGQKVMSKLLNVE